MQKTHASTTPDDKKKKESRAGLRGAGTDEDEDDLHLPLPPKAKAEADHYNHHPNYIHSFIQKNEREVRTEPKLEEDKRTQHILVH